MANDNFLKKHISLAGIYLFFYKCLYYIPIVLCIKQKTMNKNIKKKFDNTELQHSSVHHLLAIHTLLKDNGYARAIDIANYLELTRGSVSITLQRLKKKGYIREDATKFMQLSPVGLKLVNAVLSKRRLVKTLLSEILGVPEEYAEEDACKVEHLLTRQTSAKIFSFIGFYQSDNTKAQAFQKEYKEFLYQCNHHDDSCNTCETECYFAGHEELFSQ